MCFGMVVRSTMSTLPLPVSHFENLSTQNALAVIAAASFVVMLAAIFADGHSNNKVWGICCGAICFAIAGFLFWKFKLGQGKDIEAAHMKVVATVLFVMWTFGAFILTFGGPFTTTSNGYFASWIAFIASMQLFMRLVIGKAKLEFGANVTQLQQAAANETQLTIRELLGLILGASVVELFAASSPCSKYCSGLHGYALAVGIFSVTVTGISILFAKFGSPLDKEKTKYVASFLVIWWTLGAFILTFLGPFETTGNGYFASWMAFCASCYFWVLVVGSGSIFNMVIASEEAVAKVQQEQNKAEQGQSGPHVTPQDFTTSGKSKSTANATGAGPQFADDE
eukprot:gb/GEZN01005602.1/.p1 GENE.gb/GEZN01005602.1/~~gb/GEZN01005602.1/.p1  ORF type:complete len:339 (+),score=56.47 gb/GEZN01005602.1/:60-1076(+)